MGRRTPLVAIAAVAAGAFSLSGAASAPLAAGPRSLADLNPVRVKLGLAPLRRNPIAEGLVAEIASGDVADTLPEALDYQLECAVCQRALGATYERRGGKGAIGFALWRAGWTVEQNLAVFFRASALVLDPRARTFSAATTPGGMLLLAVTIDRSAPRRAVTWPAGPIDPRRQTWIEVLLPPGTTGNPYLLEPRGSRSALVAYALADERGIAGARLVGFGLNSALAYGHRYTARIGRVAIPFRTRPAPKAFLRKSWVFASMTPAEKRAFVEVAGRAPALLRRILAELDGATVVVGSGRGCIVADACERTEDGRATIGFSKSLAPYVVFHELGHVVFDLGLDEAGIRVFRQAALRAGWRFECCTPLTEVFADSLAFWALGGRPPGVDAYLEKMLLDPDQFAGILRENATYRPLPLEGTLGR